MNDLSILLMSIVASVVIILFFLRKWLHDLYSQKNTSAELVEWLKDVGKRVDTSTKQFNQRLDESSRVIAQVQQNIGEFSEIGRSMKEIQEFLQSPKLRGNMGEQVLRNLLEQFLPKSSYKLQYTFSNGLKVDAVLETSQGLIPIDAKFPLENFKKMLSAEDKNQRKEYKRKFASDVKGHIKAVSAKYVQVDEGTVDYALMYMPSESIYYEVINSQILYDLAQEERILVVSPMSFYAYIRVILMSLEGQKIEKRAGEILSLLKSMQKDYKETDQALSILHKHITNAYNQINNVSKHLNLFGQRLQSTRLLDKGEAGENQSKK